MCTLGAGAFAPRTALTALKSFLESSVNLLSLGADDDSAAFPVGSIFHFVCLCLVQELFIRWDIQGWMVPCASLSRLRVEHDGAFR